MTAVEVVAFHQKNPDGQHDGWWECTCGEPFSPEHQLAALSAAGYVIVSDCTRWYSVAYRAASGNVVTCSGQTVLRERAEEEMARMKADDFISRDCRDSVFLVFRDVPKWQPVIT